MDRHAIDMSYELCTLWEHCSLSRIRLVCFYISSTAHPLNDSRTGVVWHGAFHTLQSVQLAVCMPVLHTDVRPLPYCRTGMVRNLLSWSMRASQVQASSTGNNSFTAFVERELCRSCCRGWLTSVLFDYWEENYWRYS